MQPAGNNIPNNDAPTGGILQAIPKTNPFVTPEGYFERELSRLQAVCLAPIQHSFATPEEYFQALPERINHLLLLEKTDWVAAPENYFNDFPSRMQQQLFPAKESAFHVPDAYFDSLAMRVQQRIRKQETGRVLAFQPSASLLRPVLAAASLFLILSVGLYFYLNTPLQTETLAAKKNPAPVSIQNETPELAQLDETTLAEAAAAAQVELTLPQTAQPEKETLAAEKHAVSDYLLHNNIDENELTEMIGG